MPSKVRFRNPPSKSKSATRLASSSIPAPFQTAPISVQLLTDEFDESKIYITHIDNHPTARKKLIFNASLGLNLLVVGFLGWLGYRGIPFYVNDLRANILKLLDAASGNDSRKHTSVSKDGRIDFGQCGRIRQGGGSLGAYYACMARLGLQWLKTLGWDFGRVLFDYWCFTYLGQWPYRFFFKKNTAAARYRYGVGFRKRELVVRVSKDSAWEGQRDLFQGEKKGEKSPFWMTRVIPAVMAEKLSEKSGMLLGDADWDLDYSLMLTAESFLEAGKKSRDDGLQEKDLNGWVWGFVEGVGWVRWGFHKNVFQAVAASASQDSQASRAEMNRSGSDEDWEHVTGDVDEGKRMVNIFRDKLVSMGKEDLFFKWVELIQYESSRPGGFTKERQIETGIKVKELFDRFAVDFDRFQEDVGIVDGKFVAR
jgi:hypothetical protein